MLDLKKMLEDWPSPLIARSKIGEFTKGAYKPNTFAVYDSSKCGVTPRFKINKKVFYFTTDVISWFIKRKKNNV